MEGLIPYLIHAIKRQKLQQHTHGYSRCLSDGSRRQSYHLLASAGNSFSGSSHHRRTQSEFMPPASIDLQPEVEEFVRSRSFKMSNNNNNNNANYGLRETHHRAAVARNYDYTTTYDNSGYKGIKKS